MLEMRPDCERCGKDLGPTDTDAFICSFECTFCAECVIGPLAYGCPNCGGDLRPRPTRSKRNQQSHPASTERRGPR